MRACLLLLLVATADAQDTFAVEPLKPDPGLDARVEALIESLRGIEQEHDGITCWSGGGIGFDATNEDAPPAFRALVRLGPAAIPALLDHLTDKRRTRLWFRHDPESDTLSSMFLLPEIPAGDSEELARIRRTLGVQAIKNGPRRLELPDERINDYTVTIGDCCYTILGQIVNRSYEAVRFQPSTVFIVSSPTEEPGIAKVLRGRWGRADPRQLLAKSLLHDFRRGRKGAEERLLLYFPEEAGPMVARQIARIDWEELGYDGRGMLWSMVQTGHPLIRAEWLKLLDPSVSRDAQLAALHAAPRDPGDEARGKIRALLDKSDDVEILVGCLRALPGDRPEALQPRLEAIFARVETRDQRAAQEALVAMVLVDDERSIAIFRRHIERVGAHGAANAIYALHESPGSRLAAALLPLLLDEKSLPFQFGSPQPFSIPSGSRVCDWAAYLVTKSRPDLAFDREAPVEERDRQIAAIRAALAK